MNALAKALSLIQKQVRLPLGSNCHYKQKQFFKLLAATSCLNWFAEGVSNAFQKTLPQADTLFYHLKKLNCEAVQQMFDQTIKDNLKQARRLNLLSKPVWLAVDFTGDAFYGEGASFARAGKAKAGTNWFCQYLVASIVQDRKRFVIAALPYGPLEEQVEVLDKLLDDCKALVKIECILLDRGFFYAGAIRLLESKRLQYVMPGVRNTKVKKLEKTISSFPTTIPFILNKQETRLIFVKDKEDVLIFCTNRACWRSKLTEYYAKRWGIETSFRVCDGLQAKTCSRSHVVRVFLFYFAIALYNCLQLGNIFSREARFIALAIRLYLVSPLFCSVKSESPPPN